jgi:hypothetical protein
MKQAALAILALLFINGSSASAEDGFYNYTVKPSDLTLHQIARDVYHEQLFWKAIVAWNHLAPPYKISVGQILHLKSNPTHADIPVEQLPESAGQDRGALPSVKQTTETREDGLYYQVNERANSLHLISQELYGDDSHMAKIIQWNHLEKPYRVKWGDWLRLNEKPRSADEGNAALIGEWKRLGNDWMAGRIQAISLIKQEPAKAAPIVVVKEVPKAPPLAQSPVSRWSLSFVPSATFSRIDGTDHVTGASVILLSGLQAGGDGYLSRSLGGSWFLTLALGASDVRYTPNEGQAGKLFDAHGTALRYGLGILHEGKRWWWRALILNSDEVYFHSTDDLSNMQLKIISVPRLNLDAKIAVYQWARNSIGIAALGAMLSPVETGDFNTRLGWQAGGGPRIGRDFSKTFSMDLGGIFQYAETNTSAASIHRTDLLINSELKWSF